MNKGTKEEAGESKWIDDQIDRDGIRTSEKKHTTNSNAMITKYIIIRTNRWLWNINIYLFYEPVVNSALYLHLHM